MPPAVRHSDCHPICRIGRRRLSSCGCLFVDRLVSMDVKIKVEPIDDLQLDQDALDFLPTPTVTSITSVPKHQNQPLEWHHKVNLMGASVPSPRIHLCDSCQQPILVYGRLVSRPFRARHSLPQVSAAGLFNPLIMIPAARRRSPASTSSALTAQRRSALSVSSAGSRCCVSKRRDWGASFAAAERHVIGRI